MAPNGTTKDQKKVPNGKAEFRHNDLTGLGENVDKFMADYETNFKPPEFTIKELRECVPPELFEKNRLKGAGYIIGNIGICAAMIYGATFIDYLPSIVSWLVWPIYWWFQGVFFTGIWVLGHDSGHQAFSNSKTTNNIIGFILHSALLTPYHSWRISHSIHHATTVNIERDQHYIPKRRSEVHPEGEKHSAWKEAWETSPIYVFIYVMSFLLFGFWTYIVYNKTGQKYPGIVSHFYPKSAIYDSKQYNQIVASDIGVLTMFGMLCYWGYQTSFWTVVKYYGVPYLGLNAWLVIITLLHHSDVFVPYYTASAWSFTRGSVSTVDRDFGWFLNHAFHHISDSHVVHHLFSQMPFYNAIKATPYIKEKLGEYYLHDNTPIWKTLVRILKNCDFVEDNGEVLFYRKKWSSSKDL